MKWGKKCLVMPSAHSINIPSWYTSTNLSSRRTLHMACMSSRLKCIYSSLVDASRISSCRCLGSHWVTNKLLTSCTLSKDKYLQRGCMQHGGMPLPLAYHVCTWTDFWKKDTPAKVMHHQNWPSVWRQTKVSVEQPLTCSCHLVPSLGSLSLCGRWASEGMYMLSSEHGHHVHPWWSKIAWKVSCGT